LAVASMSSDRRASYDRYLQDLSYETSMIQSTFYDGKREGLVEGKREGLVEGKREGLVEGKVEGKREEKMEIARNLKAEGFDATQIARLTGLSLADIHTL